VSRLAKMPATERAVYTVEEVAHLLSISRNTCYEGVARGEIPAVRIGNRILIPKATFDAWLSDAGQP
jgi:excisionase family DNA binding protein